MFFPVLWSHNCAGRYALTYCLTRVILRSSWFEPKLADGLVSHVLD